MQKRFSSDTIIAIIFLTICGVLFRATFSFREMSLSIVTSDVWPRIVIIFLFIFSCIYLIQSIRAPAKNESVKKSEDSEGWFTTNRNVIWCFSLFTVFLLSLPYLGMLVGGGCFVFASLTAMGKNNIKSHATNLVIAVVSMCVIWALFTFGLNVLMPTGTLFSYFN